MYTQLIVTGLCCEEIRDATPLGPFKLPERRNGSDSVLKDPGQQAEQPASPLRAQVIQKIITMMELLSKTPSHSA